MELSPARTRALVAAPHLSHGTRDVVLFVWLGGVLAAAALACVTWTAGFATVGHLVATPAWAWLGLAAAAEVVAYAGYIAAFHEIVRAGRGPELRWRHVTALVADGFGMFVPRGGFAADCEALELAGCDRRDARRRVVGLGALEWAALAPATCVAAIVLLARGSAIGGAMTLPWAIAVPIGFAGAFAVLACTGRLTALCRLGAGAFAGMTLYYAAEILALWACLRMFSGHAPSIPAVLIGYATGYALTRRTLPLAGAGAVEALLPFALLWVNVPLAQAVLAVVFYRLVNLWIPLLPALAGRRAMLRRAAA